MSKKVSKKAVKKAKVVDAESARLPSESIEDVVESGKDATHICIREPSPAFRIQKGDRIVSEILADGQSVLIQFHNSRGERRLLSESEFKKYFRKA